MGLGSWFTGAAEIFTGDEKLFASVIKKTITILSPKPDSAGPLLEAQSVQVAHCFAKVRLHQFRLQMWDLYVLSTHLKVLR